MLVLLLIFCSVVLLLMYSFTRDTGRHTARSRAQHAPAMLPNKATPVTQPVMETRKAA